jgi:hypothetical protein
MSPRILHLLPKSVSHCLLLSFCRFFKILHRADVCTREQTPLSHLPSANIRSLDVDLLRDPLLQPQLASPCPSLMCTTLCGTLEEEGISLRRSYWTGLRGKSWADYHWGNGAMGVVKKFLYVSKHMLFEKSSLETQSTKNTENVDILECRIWRPRSKRTRGTSKEIDTIGVS